VKDHLYFIGIAGHAMRGLALAAKELGYTVSGFDPGAVPPGSDWLDEQGIEWFTVFEASQLDDVAKIVITGAHVSPTAEPIVEAKTRGIPVVSYAELFGELTKAARVVDVIGTHGKTTTTALIAWLLESAGRQPDFLVGIRPFNFDSSVRLTGSDLVVAEGDEYRASPLETRSKVEYHHPEIIVLTSVEHDHPDFFPDLKSVVDRFKRIVASVPKNGHLIAWGEDGNVKQVMNSADCTVTTYGLKVGDYIARNIAYQPTGLEFDVELGGELLGRFAVGLYGAHNVLNSLAAVAASRTLGLSFAEIAKGGAGFKGTYRRFMLVTKPDDDVTVIDDYAHHPTEVQATITAAKMHFPGRRLVILFRPHTFTRTAALLTEYHHAFEGADIVYITDIEGARETGVTHDVSGEDIVRRLKVPSHYVPDRQELQDQITANIKTGDVILCMSVSGYENFAQAIVENII
jgi:UDP-N-acetylmuramate--L-alanine ligase